ncbi:phage holin [Enterococcus gilvus]|uniref:phage holin n=1 Tax=Enterococcus gilvus TaxID=160453 RepID=UPI003D6ABB38
MYDNMKWVVMVLMPAFTTLVGGLGKVYGWDNTEIAVTTLTLLTTFMGTVTVKSASNYNKED